MPGRYFRKMCLALFLDICHRIGHLAALRGQPTMAAQNYESCHKQENASHHAASRKNVILNFMRCRYLWLA